MRLRALVLGALVAASLPTVALAQGVTLDQYRAAETVRDGFVVTRARAFGHLDVGGSLHVDYAYAPLRGPASASGATLVEHELVGQAGVSLGLLHRFVVALRVPVVFHMGGLAGTAGDPSTRDPGVSGATMGDIALSFRAQLVGDEDDTFALALQLEGTAPMAEAISASQDLAGEAGVSFTPELAAELRFAPVWIAANLGARFRQPGTWQTLMVRNELVWALAAFVDIVPDVLTAEIEGFGASPFDGFATSRLSPVEVLGGVRVRPIPELYLGLAGGGGLGDGWGAPVFRGVFSVGVADVHLPPPELEPELAAEETAEESAPEATADEVVPDEEVVVAPPPEHHPFRVPPPEPGDYGHLDRDGDRIVDAEDHCVLDREDFDEIVDRDGCPEEDADGDAVADGRDACPTTAGVASDDPTLNGCPERAHIDERGEIVITDRVEFAFGSDRILPASEAVLRDVLAILLSAEDVRRVRIEGHTDDRGSARRNWRLSRARAASVMAWLVEHGVAADRLESWGCGESAPLVEGHGDAARQTNRRVEFFIVDPMTAGLVIREGCMEGAP